jgi:uncharacterized protein (UPF0332 family)
MAFADDLLKDAYHLAGRGGKRPKQSSLRRAVSTAYYAAFHLLIADFVANWPQPDQRARLGRMFEHRRISGAALNSRDKKNPTSIEAHLQKLIGKFAKLQNDRYEADYDMGRKWSRYDVENTLALATEVFHTWRSIRNEKAISSSLAIHPRIRRPHLRRLAARTFNLDQLAFSNSRTVSRGLLPLAFGIHQLRPERKNAALRGFRRMNGAPLVPQEMALAVARHPEPQQVPGAIDVAPLEVGRWHIHVLSHARQIRLGDVNKALLAATVGASGLAFES